MTIRFDDRVAIVTGAGGGLGRQHALALGRRGCKVVVNDFGGGRDGTGGSASPAEQVAAEIVAAGGEAIAAACSVTDVDGVQAMVQSAMDTWGRVDILVNNAGVLRDKTFAKMELADFRFVLEVHLMGAVICSKAVWEIMRAQNYGRIAMTTSSSGLYGNFGQSNYAAAKMGLVGLMQTLAIEGAKYDIRVNSLAPTAATRMTEDLGGPLDLDAIRPDLVSPGLLHLVSENAPTRAILCAGAGGFEAAHVTLTQGIFADGADAAEQVATHWAGVQDPEGQIVPASGAAQGMLEMTKAARAKAGA
jgi:NAD(P)-dependent dehydrogenase (short-subunit alcohol dehydrogenase family)